MSSLEEEISSAIDASAADAAMDAEWVVSMDERLKQFTRGESSKDTGTIFRVPKSIRDVKPSAYEPQIVSFGPYHHGRRHLKAMEEQKWFYLQDLLRRNAHVTLESYLRKMKELEKRTRSCYADPFKEKEDNGFPEMMTLDGCFLVEFVIKYEEYRQRQRWNRDAAIDRSKFCTIVNDMMMLENQLPFFVLQGIFSVLQGDNEESDQNLIKSFLNILKDFSPVKSTNLPSQLSSPRHLVDLLHSFIFPKRKHEQEPWSPLDIIDCATELERAGVQFKEKTNYQAVEVLFDDGIMYMSPLSIYDHTDIHLRNLIAFEQCFSAAGDGASSYAVLMDFLIDTPADVAALRRRGVLLNGLGSDKEAASFFNSLCKEMFTYRTGKLYADVRKYCKQRRRKWRAELVHDYLRSPWKFMSVVAAVFLLLLTLIQTVFTVLAYFHSPL